MKGERKGDTLVIHVYKLRYVLPLLSQVDHLHIFVVIDTHMW